MTLPRFNKSNGGNPPGPRVPLRWAIILSIGTDAAIKLGTTANATAGVSAGIALAILLHNMIE